MVFFGAVLKNSYDKEKNLLKNFFNKDKDLHTKIVCEFTTDEVIIILRGLSFERKLFFIEIVKNLGNMVVALHFSKISENFLKTKISRLFMAMGGLLACGSELISN